jgi:tetratricopeptide (TPR) repeat protein
MFRIWLKEVALLVSALYLCSCASIVSGGPKTLPIMSQPDEANCEIIDIRTGNIILKAKTPYTAVLERSAGFFQSAKYKVKLTKDGYLPLEQQLDSGINGWYFGNIIFGGLIGILIVDPATGAMWKINNDNINAKLYPDNKEGKAAMATEKYNGGSAFNSGDYDQAINETTIAIGYYPEYVDGYCVRSASYAKKGDLDKALADANEAIKLNPDYHRGYKERAELYFKKGEFDKSLADLNKALSIKADYAEALYVRGKTYTKLNKNVEAKTDFQSACKMGSSEACNQQF